MNERSLEGRVAIVTGAGRGLGRSHALALARRGARVVVNDVGGDVHGTGDDRAPAQGVVDEIVDMGGQAVASGHDLCVWSEARDLVHLAVEEYGDLHILVNNAGVLRDRMLANMTQEEWDAVIRVHLSGGAAATGGAVAFWRARAKAGHPVAASVVHTTSISGFIGGFGQANYAAAKMGVIGLSAVVAAEYGAIGVRSNVVSPMALTRMAGVSQLSLQASDGGDQGTMPPRLASELLDPGRVSIVVAWLASASCVATGQVLHVYGNHVMVLAVPAVIADLRSTDAWDETTLDARVGPLLPAPMSISDFFDEPGAAFVTLTGPPRR